MTSIISADTCSGAYAVPQELPQDTASNLRQGHQPARVPQGEGLTQVGADATQPPWRCSEPLQPEES